MAQNQYITFKLGEDLYGIDIMFVREINRNIEMTPIDRSPAFIKGLINLRGQIVTVLDLRVRLGMQIMPIKNSTTYIVFKTNTELEKTTHKQGIHGTTSDDLIGLLVDEIGDVVTAEITPLYANSHHDVGVPSEFLEGIVKLDNKLIAILKPDEILSISTEKIAL